MHLHGAAADALVVPKGAPDKAAAMAFIVIGPAIMAYRCWGLGVQRAGPVVAGFFINLTPLFAAILSAAVIGEAPQPFHGVAFVLIVAGIVWAAYWTVTTFFISRELQGQRKFGVVGTVLWIAALIGAGMALRAFVSE